MKIVVFGLTITSSWGNGHATLWRGLCKALSAAGHRVEFFERDVPYYSASRDFCEGPYGGITLYQRWGEVRDFAEREVRDADAVVVTSYCPDALAAAELAFETSPGLCIFYDLDTPVTLARLDAGHPVDYIGPRGLADFDLVLSFTGGGALDALRHRLGARHVEPLYGHVDPDVHRPTAPKPQYQAALSYLGTYSEDRQFALERLFVASAVQRPNERFLIGGAQYPQDFPWSPNIHFVRHLPPAEHAAFFFLVSPDVEFNAAINGADGLVPLRPAVRGGGVRHSGPERLLGWPRRFLPARLGAAGCQHRPGRSRCLGRRPSRPRSRRKRGPRTRARTAYVSPSRP